MTILRHIGLCVIALTWAHASFAQNSEYLGFELGELGSAPQNWRVPSAGWTASLTEERAAEGVRSVKLQLAGKSTAPFGNLSRTFDAAQYQGKKVTLRAKILVAGPGRGQMWLRVDRLNGEMGAFDNMDDRPITAGDWACAVIEAEIEDDAQYLNVGFISIDGATLFVDAVTLESIGEGSKRVSQPPSVPRPLSPRGIENVVAAARLVSYVRFFHPSDQARSVEAWDHFAVELMERVESATEAEDLATRLREAFKPIAPTLEIWAGPIDAAPKIPDAPEGATELRSWKHSGLGALPAGHRSEIYESEIERRPIAGDEIHRTGMYVVKALGGGVSCRLPVRCYANDKGTMPQREAPGEWNSTRGQPALNVLNRSTRLAGVALTWGVMQHFYPYFDTVQTDWDSALTVALIKAAEDKDLPAYLSTLREMIAKLHDGHAAVSKQSGGDSGSLPLALEWVGEDLVVVGADANRAGAVRVGDVVVSIDGRSSEDCHQQVSRWISSPTEQWRRWQSGFGISMDLPTKNPARITLTRPKGHSYSIIANRVPELPETIALPKPNNGREVAPGIVYFNLVGATPDELHKAMSKLEAARGIIFDFRGYPSHGARELISHLIDAPVASPRWVLPVFRLPDREEVEWVDLERWSLPPKTPRLKASIAFLTDGRAISYAESVLGIIEHYQLGEIVGSATAGTNGDVNSFTLPGGYIVSWSGLKVLKHDGGAHHGVGIAPTVAVRATPKGIAAGKDEVLQKAVEVLRTKIDGETIEK